MSENSEKKINNTIKDVHTNEYYLKRKKKKAIRKKIIWTLIYSFEVFFIVFLIGVGLYTGFVGRFPFDFAPKYSSGFFEDVKYEEIVKSEIADYYAKDAIDLGVVNQTLGEQSVQHNLYTNLMSERFLNYAADMFAGQEFMDGYYNLRGKLVDWVPVDEIVIKRPSTYYYYKEENMVQNDFESMEENIKDIYLVGDRKEIATAITSFLLLAGMDSEDIMINIPHVGERGTVISLVLPTSFGVRHYIYDRKTWSYRDYGVNDTWSDYIYNLNYLTPEYMYNDEVDHTTMDSATAKSYEARTTHSIETMNEEKPRVGYDYTIEQLDDTVALKANLENYVYEQAKNEANLYMTEVKYAYKSLFVKYPELYLEASQQMQHVIDYVKEHTIDDELAFMNTVAFDPHSIYNEDYRMMRADQVLFYKRGEANDVANLLYTMATLQGKEALITFTNEAVYLVYEDNGEVKIINTISKEFVDEVRGNAYLVMDDENAYYPLMHRYTVTKAQKSLLDKAGIDLGDNIVIQ